MTKLDGKFTAQISDERLKSGISEYIRLWNNGLKKQANTVVKGAMEYLDTLSDTEQAEFFDTLCEALEAKGEAQITHGVSVRLREYLSSCTAKDLMPQSRWYCLWYGRYGMGLDEVRAVYGKHSDDSKLAELYYRMLLSELYFGAHHFPEGCCISVEEYREYCSECERVIKAHSFDSAGYLHYKWLYEAYYSWDRNSDFKEYCKSRGAEFEEVCAYYYSKRGG